jgi:hypothetical protein
METGVQAKTMEGNTGAWRAKMAGRVHPHGVLGGDDMHIRIIITVCCIIVGLMYGITHFCR